MAMMSRHSLLFLAVLGLVSWICHANPTTTPADNAGLTAAINSNAHFSRQLLRVVGDSNSNVVMSPLSAQLALALANLGARGNTANQISTALNIQQNAQPNFAQLINLLLDQNDTEVRIANRAYASHRVTLRPEFVQAARDTLNADALSVTFGTPETEDAINQWVEEITNGKIKNLIQRGSLDARTISVLINALYFKAKWYTNFDRESTGLFHVSQNNAVNTTFLNTMTLSGDHINYAALPELSARLLDLPYKNDRFRFLILLPDESSSLAALETSMRTKDINSLLQLVRPSSHQRVVVPKIELDVAVDLKEPFEQLGMTDMFTQGVADFSGLVDGGPRLYVSKVLQKTYLKLTLQGTEAASATFFKMYPLSGVRNPPPPFIADRPFLFYLVHRTTEESTTVLFSGRYVSP
ncbi:hypothetical protein B566_EDAN005419 [Ephemera danica]|nr:hypothetical protein B566_EDAN005419 [Ephemera danica]